MKKISTVILRYENQDRAQYQVLAEFMRLAGIFVWEHCETLTDFVEDLNDYQLSDDTLLYNVTPIKNIQFDMNGQARILIKFKMKMKEQINNTLLKEIYNSLVKIYINNKLFISAVTVQYFRYQTKKTEEAIVNFDQAAKDIQNTSFIKSFYDNWHIRYAELYCLYKSNLACILCNQPLKYFVNELAQKCEELVDEYRNCDNTVGLLGLIYDLSGENGRDALESYDMLVNEIKEYPYASSIYYWCGKCYEGMKNFKNQAEDAYLAAYKSMKKYRNMYKMGIASEWSHNWSQAIQYYQQGIQLLDVKHQYLDPLEIEYYYKMLVRISYNYIINEVDLLQGIETALDALEFNKSIRDALENDGVYALLTKHIYGKNDYKEYLRLALSRQKEDQVRFYLSKAYVKLGLLDEARKILI